MNPVRKLINDLIAGARQKAAIAQIRRELDEQLFLFAIEIGRAKRLIPDERRAYAKTFRTAQVMLLLREVLASKPPKMTPIKNILKQPEEEWLLKEPVIKAELESRLHQRLNDLDDSTMSPPDRIAIIRYLHQVSQAYPKDLSVEELKSIVDRLDHPLDRA